MRKEKTINSFSELSKIISTDKLETPAETTIIVEKKEQPKKEKQLYESADIRIKGRQLVTTDGSYETYSVGAYTSWRITMMGLKNGSIDVGNNIGDGYPHASFHDKSRAATLLIEMINRN